MVKQVAVISLRIDRSERIERRLRDRAMLRAELAWDEDRMIEDESLDSKLSRRPLEIVRQLRATPQGCDWLLERWSILARAADQNSSWTSDQTRLAFDLLRTPVEAREGRQPGDLVNLDGTLIEPSVGSLNVARREVDRLLERRAVVADLDEADRALVSTDQFDETNTILERLRRHENTLHNRLRWFINQMHDPSPYVLKSHEDLKPNWVQRIEPPASDETLPTEPPPHREIHPPFDLTPDEFPEPGEFPHIPQIIANRREQQIRKAEARRDAKRRRVERLRD